MVLTSLLAFFKITCLIIGCLNQNFEFVYLFYTHYVLTFKSLFFCFGFVYQGVVWGSCRWSGEEAETALCWMQLVVAYSAMDLLMDTVASDASAKVHLRKGKRLHRQSEE